MRDAVSIRLIRRICKQVFLFCEDMQISMRMHSKEITSSRVCWSPLMVLSISIITWHPHIIDVCVRHHLSVCQQLIHLACGIKEIKSLGLLCRYAYARTHARI